MGEEIKEPTIKDLLDELNYIRKSKISDRVKILNLQLYSEHFINELLMHFVDKDAMGKEVKTWIPFPKKLKILKRNKVIGNPTENILMTLNDVRNEVLHNLVVDEKLINEKLKSRKLGFDYKVQDYKTGKIWHSSNLEEIYKKSNFSKFSQLEVSCVLIITLLYSGLNHVRKKEPAPYLVIPELKKDNEGNSSIDLKLGEIKNTEEPAK